MEPDCESWTSDYSCVVISTSFKSKKFRPPLSKWGREGLALEPELKLWFVPCVVKDAEKFFVAGRVEGLF
jgi:hypothetical protein